MNTPYFLTKEQSLKRSVLVSNSRNPYMNTVSSRPNVSRSSYGQERSSTQMKKQFSNLGNFGIQSNLNLSASHITQLKTDSYISNKPRHNRQLSKQYNINTNIEKKLEQIDLKIQKIFNNLEKHTKQISFLQKQQSSENEQKNDIIKKCIHEIASQRDKHYILQNKLFKADLDTIKFQIRSLAQKKQVDKKFTNSQNNLRESFWQIKNMMNQQFGQFQKKQGQARKRDYQSLTKQIQSQMKSLKNYIHHVDIKNLSSSIDTKKQLQGNLTKIFKSTQKNFIIPSLLIKLQSKMYIINGQKEKQLDKNQIVYMVDSDGFLLDSENRYILDHSNKQIQLSQQHIQILKQTRILF